MSSVNSAIDESSRSEEQFDSAAPSDEQTVQVKPKTKRGSSGLANLQKARARKMLRKQRMKNLMERRSRQKSRAMIEPAAEEDEKQTDYFLGDRQQSPGEKLIIALRLSSLVKDLHEGVDLHKSTSESMVEDGVSFPAFNVIKTAGLDITKNPLEWTVQEVCRFVNHISTVKNIAKGFRSEEIDGEALLNITLSDLVNHFQFDVKISDILMKVLKQLRDEVIQRYVNI